MNNPFEGDPDFQYLFPDKKLMMDEQAKPFDAKASCWIPDAKEGYLAATITATKGDDVTVHTEKSEVSSGRMIICYGTIYITRIVIHIIITIVPCIFLISILLNCILSTYCVNMAKYVVGLWNLVRLS